MERPQPTKLYHHLKKWLEKAVMDYGMITEGDRVLVGVSGGSDSLALLDLLNTPMVFTPSFELFAVHVDLGFDPEGADASRMEGHLREGGYRHIVARTAIGPLSHGPVNRKNPCFLCSRLRRKRIFEAAEELGCNRIAFAHHRDDIVETVLLNMFFAREISTMVPNQPIFRGKLSIIRPLAYIREPLLKKYAGERGFSTVENRCPTSRMSKRRYIKELLDRVESDNRDVRDNIFRALGRVKADYLLAAGRSGRGGGT